MHGTSTGCIVVRAVHNPFTEAQLITWAVVTTSQIVVAVPAWRVREYAIAIYLSCLPLMSLVAALLVATARMQLYLKAYIAAGYVESALTTLLLLSLLDELRKRARPGRRSPFLVVALFAFSTGIARVLCRIPVVAHPTVLTSLRTHGYVAYTAMAFLLMLLPIYAFFTLSFPTWRQLLKIFALSCVIALHASLFDHLLSFPANSPQALKRLHDYAYLFPLLLWFAVFISTERSPRGADPGRLRNGKMR